MEGGDLGRRRDGWGMEGIKWSGDSRCLLCVNCWGVKRRDGSPTGLTRWREVCQNQLL
jgi:hypothetical protein